MLLLASWLAASTANHASWLVRVGLDVGVCGVGVVEVVTIAHAPALHAQTWHLRPLSVVAPTHRVSGGAQLSEQSCCTADLSNDRSLTGTAGA